jgi:YD repeat-containing protein
MGGKLCDLDEYFVPSDLDPFVTLSFKCATIVDNAELDHGCTKNAAGNPCNVSTGNKFQSETDFSSGGLSFVRSYNSQNLSDIGMGRGWRHNHQRKLMVDGDTLTQISGTGKGKPWQKVNGVWEGNADYSVVISETIAGFQLMKHNGAFELYSANGTILSATTANGQQTNYTYNAEGLLESVLNHYGSEITLSYVNGNVTSVTDSVGAVYSYEYHSNGELEAVVYPDLTAGDTDNPRRTYLYEAQNLPSHLTGIVDENGDRYATWAYQSDGKAILSKHAETSTINVGQETFEFEYNYQVGSE